MSAGRRTLIAAGLAALAAPARADRSVVDATGRRTAVPDRVTRVLPAGSPAAILLYGVETVIGTLDTPDGPRRVCAPVVAGGAA